ncbi:RcnB family protein [Pseudooceanicola algae]|uniref:Nickel/cobalt homeostasis protein RcnB n=1 Tax=Pseudooceanicola algae TaxID=1537215 RepID=A0A418SGQ6_9RHOB|nr:RcnB family protein [Pseudooceanicola algae]QPM88889.1 hypothetical protein PSAL_000920 [Pseudooceanicola algae]
MKRIIITVLAASVLLSGMANAQTGRSDDNGQQIIRQQDDNSQNWDGQSQNRNDQNQNGQSQHGQNQSSQGHDNRNQQASQNNRAQDNRAQDNRQAQSRAPQNIGRGEALPNGYREVGNYRDYGLPAPGNGYRYAEYNGEIFRIAAQTAIVAATVGIVANLLR